MDWPFFFSHFHQRISSISMALAGIYTWIDSQGHSSNPDFSLDSKCCYIYILGISTSISIEIYPKLSLLFFFLLDSSHSPSLAKLLQSFPTYLLAPQFPPFNLSTTLCQNEISKMQLRCHFPSENSFLTLSTQIIKSKFLDMT